MNDFLPHLVHDPDTGRDVLAIDATYTVVGTIDRGEQTIWAEPATYNEAKRELDELAAQGVAADIEIDLHTVDLAEEAVA